MILQITDEILEKIDQAAVSYHRLVLVVAPSGAGKTAALQDVQKRIGAPLLNVNLELSRGMLELTIRQRALQIRTLLSSIIDQLPGDVILLDNLEMLFDVSLKQLPLNLLQRLSRTKTLVASWSGKIEGGYLYYAKPDHPEYQRFLLENVLVVTPVSRS